MLDRVIGSEEARTRLPEMLRALRSGGAGARRYVIGRHRKPEAVLISVRELERLEAARDSGASPLAELRRNRPRIVELARRRGISRVRVFGSAARGDAGPDSDIDLLVRIDRGRSLLDLGGFQADVAELLGRRVDVVSEAGVRGDFARRALAEAVEL